MDDLLRIWTDLIDRLSGPMTFRLFLQPVMAMLHAVRDGVKDAHEGRPPYLWAIFTDTSHRQQLLKEGVSRVRRVILLGIGMDNAPNPRQTRLYPGYLHNALRSKSRLLRCGLSLGELCHLIEQVEYELAHGAFTPRSSDTFPLNARRSSAK